MKRFIFIQIQVYVFCILSVLDSLPLQAATKAQYRTAALKQVGNAAKGRALFVAPDRTGCSLCHTVDGSSKLAGPDLMSAGDTFPRGEMIQAILEPSREIAVGYEHVSITTRSGDVLQGTIKNKTESSIILVGLDGIRREIQSHEIEKQTAHTISLMPEGLHAGLSLEEFTDLIDYLVTLKQPENTFAIQEGMPQAIPTLTTMATLRPFISEEMRFSHAFVVHPGDIRYGLTWFEQMPGMDDTFVVADQRGKIWLINKEKHTKEIFADFQEELFNRRGPNGLLSMAFHPDYRLNRKYYLKHQVLEHDQIVTVVVEKRATSDLRKDSGMASRRLISMISTTQNHSGGCIRFGPDGYLYIGMGDTGPQRDPRGHGQDLGILLGKMLRIDVNGTSDQLPYKIPSDNPFLNKPGIRPEIWAYGFREPWKFSFDSMTGDLWVGDVGQDRVEEVSIVQKGENHGWNVMEGFEPFSNQYRRESETYVPPVFAYLRKYGNSVTGGYVYRGDPHSPFYGMYICGDYTSRRIWAVHQKDRKLMEVVQIATAPLGIVSFGTDSNGNIYVIGYEGMIYQLDLSTAALEN